MDRGDLDLGRPRAFCAALLAALAASEGRTRRRKRDQTPDRLGLAVKRQVLEEAVSADPAPEAFEAWLFERCLAAGPGAGAVRAMASEILRDWRDAQAVPEFRRWLAQGAPSDDAAEPGSRDASARRAPGAATQPEAGGQIRNGP